MVKKCLLDALSALLHSVGCERDQVRVEPGGGRHHVYRSARRAL